MSALELLADEFIEKVLPKLGTAMLEIARKSAHSEPDPLLTVKEAAAQLGLKDTATRRIIQAGYIPKAKGLTELRVRLSEVKKYGTTQP